MCQSGKEVGIGVVGESCWHPRFAPRSFPSLLHFRFSSLPLFLAQPGLRAGYGHFAEVYSQLQPYKSEQPLGAVSGHQYLSHRAHAGWEMRPPREKATGPASEPRLGAFPKGRRRRPNRALSQRRLSFTEPAWDAPGSDRGSYGRPLVCPGTVAAGPGPGRGEREREGSHRSPGRGVSR